MRLRGWCFVPGAPIVAVEALFPASPAPMRLLSYGLPSPDVATAIHPDAGQARFEEWVPLPTAQSGRDFTLRLRFADGSTLETTSVHQCARDGDAAHGCWYHFLDSLHAFGTGDILEIGSRARSAITRRQHLPTKLGYVGMDILPGPNVDVVGDAHQLSALFGPRKFVAAFSLSVFEHLAMPWKVAIELNRVLLPGGLVFANTHQTWPLHEEPWDFWRYSNSTWPCLFNAMTGFEIVEVAQGEPAQIHGLWDSPVARYIPESPAFLSANVIARKISETALEWPVPTALTSRGSYPAGELAEPLR
ncbi:MAG: methyltransferase domain-containing protein [Opitutus sp.]|nr:methyltransferase domain-containing protein [Opitutus sp.]